MMSVGNLFRSYFMIAKYPKQRSDCLLLVRQILAQRKTTQIEVKHFEVKDSIVSGPSARA